MTTADNHPLRACGQDEKWAAGAGWLSGRQPLAGASAGHRRDRRWPHRRIPVAEPRPGQHGVFHRPSSPLSRLGGRGHRPPVDAFRRVRYFFVWFACLIACAHLLGFLIGLPLMVLIHLLAHKEPLKLSIFLSFMVLVILYGGFQKGLVLPLPEGVLTMMLFGG